MAAKTALVPLLLLGSSSHVPAQDAPPRVEFYVGYAFLRDLGDTATNLPLGWSASFTHNPGRSLGLVLEVGGSYKSGGGQDFSQHTLLAGLRYSLRGKLTPYLEALAGAVLGRVRTGSVSVSATDFALQGGTGLGFRLGERVSMRVGVDFRNIFSEGDSFHQLRAVAGLSFGFGGGRAAPELAPPTLALPPPVAIPAVGTEGPRLRSAPPPPPTPPTTAPQPSALSQPRDAFALGQDRVRRGDYAAASAAFRDYLRQGAASRYTIAVGLFCDPAPAVVGARDVGGAENLFLLAVPYRGRACYRLYWGLYESFLAAAEAIPSIPATLRSTGQAPLPVSRLPP